MGCVFKSFLSVQFQTALDIRQSVFGGKNIHVATAHEDLAYSSYVHQYSSGKFDNALWVQLNLQTQDYSWTSQLITLDMSSPLEEAQNHDSYCNVMFCCSPYWDLCFSVFWLQCSGYVPFRDVAICWCDILYHITLIVKNETNWEHVDITHMMI